MQICKEPKIEQIKSNHNTSVINKRSIKSVPAQNKVTSTTLTDHCDLPEYDEEFSTYIIVYNETAKLRKITRSVKSNKNSARVILAIVIKEAHMIIFQMNRAAYLQVCNYTVS